MKILLLQVTNSAAQHVKVHGFTQMVTKPTRDSGTLLDHVYVTSKVAITTDVNDCYYSDHDYVLYSIHI